MESFLNRYRNITVLLLVIMAQLVLLASLNRAERSTFAVSFHPPARSGIRRSCRIARTRTEGGALLEARGAQ